MKSRRLTRETVVLAAFVAVILVGAIPAPAQARTGSPELGGLLPRLDGWAPSEAPRAFFPEDLFEYIDGAAESYLSYDFQELVVADLQRRGTEATLTVEIYDMGKPANAFGIFSAERYPDVPPAAVGALGYVDGEALNFMAGRFYVKLLAFGLGPDTAAVLQEAGRRVAGAVKDPGGLPALAAGFPPADLVARSEKYIKKNFMGYEFLRDGYVATYRLDGQDVDAFFIDGGAEANAESLLGRLRDALASDGQTIEPAGFGFHARNRYGRHLLIGRVGQVLCGVMRVPDGLESAAFKLADSLRAALAKGKSST